MSLLKSMSSIAPSLPPDDSNDSSRFLRVEVVDEDFDAPLPRVFVDVDGRARFFDDDDDFAKNGSDMTKEVDRETNADLK